MVHKRDLKKFLKKILVVQKDPPNEISAFNGFMQRQIPDKLLTEELKKLHKTALTLYGVELRDFKIILKNLRKDISTEYLKDKELEDELWYLLCDIYLNKKIYERSSNALDSRVVDFVVKICRPLKNYKVIFRIYNLEIKTGPIQILDCMINNLSEESLADIKSNMNIKAEDRILNEFAAGPIIIVPMAGNNSGLAEERAREKARFILKVAQTYLYEHRSIRDQNLLFEISESAFMKTEDSNKWFWSWKSNRKPYGLTISNGVTDFITKANNDFTIINNLTADFQDRIKRTIYWTGASIQEELIDNKVIYLCTALETLLTNKEDRKKGEIITYRMVLINHLIEGSFPEPFQLMLFYEFRSRIVHGSALNETAYSDYSTLHYIVRRTLFDFVRLVGHNRIKKYSELMKTIENKENLTLIKSYFAKFKGKWPESILELIDEKLSNF